MKKTTQIKIILSLFLLSLISTYFFFKSSNISPQKINFNNFSPQEKEYTILTNKSLIPKIQVRYPYVSTPLSNEKKYFLINLLEHLDLKQKKYDQLFFASKRLAELSKWRNNIPIKLKNNRNNLTKILTTKELLIWWGKNKPKIFEFNKYSNYNSWEATLARYYLLYNKAINKSKKDNLELKQEYGYLKKHQQYLSSVIFNSFKSNQDKIYLQSLADNIFSSLEKKLTKQIKIPQQNKIQYSLNNIVKEKEWGTYQLTIDLKTYPNLKDIPITIKLNNNLYYPEYNKKLKTLIFNNIKIDNHIAKNQVITLNFPKKNILKQGYWIKTINYQNKKPSYKYIFSSSRSFKKGQYLLNINYQNKKPISFQLKLSYQKKSKKKSKKIKTISDDLINQSLYPHLKRKVYSKQLTILDSDKKYIKSEFIINSLNKITRKELLYLKPHLYPIYQPEIELNKISSFSNIKPQINYEKLTNNQYLITVKNTTLDQENYILSSLGFGWKKVWQQKPDMTTYRFKITFWPKTVIRNLLFLLTFIFIILGIDLFYKLRNPHKPSFIDILFSKKTIKKTKFYFFIPFVFVWKLIKKISSKYRNLLFYLTILGIFFDVFSFPRNSDLLLLALTFSWTLTIIGFKTESRTSFVLALFWLILTPFFLILKKDIIAEKMAVWTYMMLVVGTIQSIIELKIDSSGLNSPQEFAQTLNKSKLNLFLINLGGFLISKIYLHLIQIKNKLIKLLKKYLSPEPKTFLQMIVYLLKIVSIIVSAFLILFFSGLVINKTNKEINKIKKDLHRKSLNPRIEKVEPTLVYKSTKVILFGKNFGWNQEDQLRIYTTQGEIRPDLVNDTKIIFTIPLHWKEGEIDIWLGKLVGWEGKTIQAFSNTVKIKLLPITPNFTSQDDLFFKQLKKLNPETRKINGYN